MSEEREKQGEPAAEHERRVHEAFDALNADLGDRAEGGAKEEIERVREAALRKNASEVRERLDMMERANSWLHSEMLQHPKIASLIDELALWGF
jgi:hypothetical protein